MQSCVDISIEKVREDFFLLFNALRERDTNVCEFDSEKNVIENESYLVRYVGMLKVVYVLFSIKQCTNNCYTSGQKAM